MLSMKLFHFQISISIYSYLFKIALLLFSILIDKILFISAFLYIFVVFHLIRYIVKLLTQYLHCWLNHLYSLTNFCIIYFMICQYHLKLYLDLIYCQMGEAPSIYFIIFLWLTKMSLFAFIFVVVVISISISNQSKLGN